MPSSILNSDDGVISGTAGLKNSGGDDGVLNIQSNGATVAVVNGSGVTVTGTLSATSFVGVFPSGTVMLFVQTNAPTGWTKSTANDNKALRVVSGTASTGGSVAFTTAFASQAVSGTVGNTTLTTAQIPSHTHQQADGNVTNVAGASVFNMSSANSAGRFDTAATGGSGSHNHSFTGTAINLAVQHVDVIIATKD